METELPLRKGNYGAEDVPLAILLYKYVRTD